MVGGRVAGKSMFVTDTNRPMKPVLCIYAPHESHCTAAIDPQTRHLNFSILHTFLCSLRPRDENATLSRSDWISFITNQQPNTHQASSAPSP